jgi:hypothetical protein
VLIPERVVGAETGSCPHRCARRAEHVLISLGEIFKPAACEKTRTEDAKVLQRLFDLPIPAVFIGNGPATVDPEYLLLSAIHVLIARHLWRSAASRLWDHRRRAPVSARRTGGSLRWPSS